MWVGEVLDGDNVVIQRYHFKFGKICKLGRAVENHISFPTDKSISRVHAEISTISATSIKVTDLGSSFGTLLNNEKLVPKKEYVIESNSVVQFGAMISKIRFTRQQISFCITRLDKEEKDRVKKNAKQVNAKLVTIADHATHVIASRCTATIKLLTAVVLNLKIVTADWLISFAETDDKNPVAILPKESDYFPPPGDEAVPVSIVDPTLSRAALFKKVAVLVLQEEDMQYSVILTACGATVKQIDAGVSISAEVIQKFAAQLSGDKAAPAAKGKKGTAAAAKSDEEEGVTVCIFFDESKGIPASKHLTAVPTGKSSKSSSSVPVKWLTIHQLAVSVMSLAPPVLLNDPPTAVVRTGSVSTTSGGDGSQSQALISNYNGENKSHRVDSNATVMEEEEQQQQPPQKTAAAVKGTKVSGIAAASAVIDVDEDEDEEVFEVTTKKAPAAAAKKGRTTKVETAAAAAAAAAATLPPLPTTASVAAASPAAGATMAASKRRFKEVAGVSEADEVRSVASSHDGGSGVGGAEEVYSSPAKKPRRGGRGSVTTPDTVTLPPPATPVMVPAMESEVIPAAPANKKQKTSTAASAVAAAVKAESVTPTVSQDTPAAAPAAKDNKRKRTTAAAKEVSNSSLPQSYNADTAPSTAGVSSSSSSYFPASSSSSSNHNTGINFFNESLDDNHNEEDGGDDAEWLPVLRGVARMQMLQTKRANTLIARQQEQEEVLDVPARSQASDAGGMVKTEGGSSSSSGRISAAAASKKKVSNKFDMAEGLSDDEGATHTSVAVVTVSSGEFTQPVVVESKSLFNLDRVRNPRVAGSTANTSSSSSSSAVVAGKGLKNMKRFQKNYYREVPAEDMFLSRAMDRVLPKESERELQLRLELESALEKENQAEQLFADRFGASGGGGRARAR